MIHQEEIHGESGSGQDDITALGGVLEFCLIHDIKSPSRLAIYFKVTPCRAAAGLYTAKFP